MSLNKLGDKYKVSFDNDDATVNPRIDSLMENQYS